MSRKLVYLSLLLLILSFFSCSGKKKEMAASMEQLHAENGQPVSVRKLNLEDFSVYLKYPAIINASSQSIAYASLDDVVRNIPVSVGDTVRQGDIILSFSADNRILQQAILSHENARTAYERINVLFRSNDVSRQDFDSVRMQYELSMTNLKAANDMVYVKAPISGTITQINVRVTENVRPGTPLFTVSNSNGFQAMLYVGANEIERIQTGARAFIDLSREQSGDHSIEGRITQVSLTMDSQKQSFPITAVFGNGSHKLASGMNVDIAVETYRNEKALVLSRQELIQTDKGPVAFLVEGNRAREVAVQTGEEKGLRLEITGGLTEGDLIVSEGIQRINAQSILNIVPAILPESSGVR